MYKYPDVHVCLYKFYGCDSLELEEDCTASALKMNGGFTTATFNPNGDDEQEISSSAFLTEEVNTYRSCGLTREKLVAGDGRIY